MKIIEQLDRLKKIHRMISSNSTGCPRDFAKRLHIGKRQLHYILDDLKLMGMPIGYDTKKRSYYYTAFCKADFDIKIEVIQNHDELKNVNGGFLPYQCKFIASLSVNFASMSNLNNKCYE